MDCFDNVFDYNALFNGTIEFTGIEETGNFTDPADVAALFSQARSMQKKYEEVGRNCLRKNDQYLKYLGTAAAVRDMLSIADALEGPNSTVNYIGTSYGTLIGSWFVNSEGHRIVRCITIADRSVPQCFPRYVNLGIGWCAGSPQHSVSDGSFWMALRTL